MSDLAVQYNLASLFDPQTLWQNSGRTHMKPDKASENIAVHVAQLAAVLTDSMLQTHPLSIFGGIYLYTTWQNCLSFFCLPKISKDDIQESLVGGFSPTHLKNMRKSKWIIFPKVRGENKPYLSCHHRDQVIFGVLPPHHRMPVTSLRIRLCICELPFCVCGIPWIACIPEPKTRWSNGSFKGTVSYHIKSILLLTVILLSVYLVG